MPSRGRGGAASDSPARLLYIGGWGRSGSTLLDRMLGEVPGFVAVGEIHFLFERGVAGNQLCGCGERFHDCPFWQAVGEEAFGGWEQVDGRALAELDREVDRLRRLHLLVSPVVPASFARNLAAYAEPLERVYRAIREVSGASVIVDSSKTPHYALVLRRVAGVDLSVAHLVRDPRAVAYSWTRRKARLEPIGGIDHMDRYRPSKSAYRWMLDNTLFHGLERLGVPRLLVRYETLVESPRRELERIVGFLGRECTGLDFVDGRTVVLGSHHTVAGNPNRTQRGPVRVEADEEWRTALSLRDRRLVETLTWPLLRRYGYAGSSSAGR